MPACALLEEEPAFQGELKFNAGRCDVIFNDRLLAPNNEETWNAVKPDLEKFFDNLFGRGNYELSRSGEPRERFRAAVTANRNIPVSLQLATETANLKDTGKWRLV